MVAAILLMSTSSSVKSSLRTTTPSTTPPTRVLGLPLAHDLDLPVGRELAFDVEDHVRRNQIQSFQGLMAELESAGDEMFCPFHVTCVLLISHDSDKRGLARV